MTTEERLAQIEKRMWAAGDQYPEWEEDMVYLFSLVRAQREVCEVAEDYGEVIAWEDDLEAPSLRLKKALKHVREVEQRAD